MRKSLSLALFFVALTVGAFACSSAASPPSQSGSSAAPPASQGGSNTTPASGSAGQVQGGQPAGGVSVLQIQPGASTATFTVDEILRGSPNTVIGKTDQVSGQIELNTNNPSATKVGTIQVDARSLATDDSQRNNMLQRFILSTSDFQFVTFTPDLITGLPASVTPGTTYPVQLDGKLTIKDVTRDVKFDASVTPMSDRELTGNATTTISQKDFGISIPQIPFVAGVTDNVKLDLNFVATSA